MHFSSWSWEVMWPFVVEVLLLLCLVPLLSQPLLVWQVWTGVWRLQCLCCDLLSFFSVVLLSFFIMCGLPSFVVFFPVFFPSFWLFVCASFCCCRICPHYYYLFSFLRLDYSWLRALAEKELPVSLQSLHWFWYHPYTWNENRLRRLWHRSGEEETIFLSSILLFLDAATIGTIQAAALIDIPRHLHTALSNRIRRKKKRWWTATNPPPDRKRCIATSARAGVDQ